ncbi:MAG: hypothetical protein COA79_01235 [Planctomycetota bacterium]|nr:MAG: hypothetical protein COA79_01235 [Planctomycetota bacterium]
MPEIRYGDYINETSLQHEEINYSDLVENSETSNNEKKSKLKLRKRDVYRLLQPYISIRLKDQLKAVVPLSIYLILFQVLILRQSIVDAWIISAGLFAVIIGLMLFIEGLKLGLMPFGETLGHSLPKKSSLPVVIIITFLLGVGVTFAEPAIGALQAVGNLVDVKRAPYLYSLLNYWTFSLVMVIGLGVGIASILGILRFIYGWSLKPIIYLTLLPTLSLTAYFALDPSLRNTLGLAWDCGAVTTGPVTVPLVLSLGIGVAASTGKGESSLSGFGIVTLASIFPILGVMLLTLVVKNFQSVEEITQLAILSQQVKQDVIIPWYTTTPWNEIILGIRAILPLVLFLLIVLKLILKEKIRSSGIVTYGIILSIVGMIVINLGLTYGLSKLGSQTGSMIPGAFSKLDSIEESPLYFYSLGVMISILFVWFLGFGSTMAEPALNTLGMTVENLTNGAFKKSILMMSVSFGVAIGLALGVCKIIFDIPLAFMIIPGYLIALVMTYFSTEEFVNIAWDSAGVTTGPVTVPLVLSLGLGFGIAVDAIDGFGVLSLASICPIICVLTCGLFIKYRNKRLKNIKNEEDLQLSD